MALFIKDAAGKYQTNLGFPGASADPKPEKSKGYPDLVIGGPGFCFPVWRWNGKAYDFHRKRGAGARAAATGGEAPLATR